MKPWSSDVKDLLNSNFLRRIGATHILKDPLKFSFSAFSKSLSAVERQVRLIGQSRSPPRLHEEGKCQREGEDGVNEVAGKPTVYPSPLVVGLRVTC